MISICGILCHRLMIFTFSYLANWWWTYIGCWYGCYWQMLMVQIIYGVWYLLMAIMVLFRSLVSVINVMYIIWCKGHVNTYDVIIVYLVMYGILRSCQICNPTRLSGWFIWCIPSWMGDWCMYESLVIGRLYSNIWVIESS